MVPNRRRIFPEDDWSIAAIKGLLGATLTRLGRYEEAETVLLDGKRELDASSSPPSATSTRPSPTRMLHLPEMPSSRRPHNVRR
jgi:hypothetical protein